MRSFYNLAACVPIVRHYASRTYTLQDRATPNNPELDAHVRSGDYFITLATNLETLAEEVGEASTSTISLTLMRLAKELDYVQRHYKIVQKNQPDPLTELS